MTLERPTLTIAFATRRTEAEAAPFARHLVETCGLPRDQVQLLPFLENQRGLASVYNEALHRTEGTYVALLHDDVSFSKSPGWARTLIADLEANPRFGILGVAGASILQENAFWLHEQVSCGHVYHRKGKTTSLARYALPHRAILPAAVLDGVLLFARTDDVKDLPLDEETFDGFHFYDVELCTKAREKGVRLGVTESVDLIHDSPGTFGEEWEKYRDRFTAKYGKGLPANAIEKADLFPFETFRKVPAKSPTVAILIPTKDRVELVRNAVSAIRSHTAPTIRYQIYILDTGSSPASLAQLKALPDVRVLELGYYHFAKIHNDVILRQNLIQEDLLLFHNNDVELVNDALSHLLDAWSSVPSPGVVGARLHFGNGLLQHAGMRVTVRGTDPVSAHHWGYLTLWNFGHETLRRVTGCTFALALLSKKSYKQFGGLNEAYESCFEDVELNLRSILEGHENLLVGDAVAIHHEGVSRNEDPAKLERLQRDFETLRGFVKSHLRQLKPHLEVLPAVDPRERVVALV